MLAPVALILKNTLMYISTSHSELVWYIKQRKVKKGKNK